MTTQQAENPTSDLPKTSAPAQRALTGAEIMTLAQLSAFSRAAIAKLHGMGPKALGILQEALAAKGLSFAGETLPPDTKGAYAAVNGLQLYYEVYGPTTSTLPPLVLLHGGLGMIEMMSEVIAAMAQERRVIAVDLQGHGRTADSDRPIRYALMGDDIAALVRHLGFAQVDVMGYSLGGGTALRMAIQHPDLMRKLVLVAVAFRRDAFYPEVLAGMEQMSGAMADFMKPGPVYQNYVRVAPQPDNFPKLLDKMGDLLRQPYDWSDEVAKLPMPVLLVFADADSFPAGYMAEFYRLLGGSQRDAGWDGAQMPQSQLAILPGLTHYTVFASPLLTAVAKPFLYR